jgi:hypothetical protein
LLDSEAANADTKMQTFVDVIFESAFAGNERKIKSEADLISKAHVRIDTREGVTKS